MTEKNQVQEAKARAYDLMILRENLLREAQTIQQTINQTSQVVQEKEREPVLKANKEIEELRAEIKTLREETQKQKSRCKE